MFFSAFDRYTSDTDNILGVNLPCVLFSYVFLFNKSIKTLAIWRPVACMTHVAYHTLRACWSHPLQTDCYPSILFVYYTRNNIVTYVISGSGHVILLTSSRRWQTPSNLTRQNNQLFLLLSQRHYRCCCLNQLSCVHQWHFRGNC